MEGQINESQGGAETRQTPNPTEPLHPPPATPRWPAVFFSVLAGACQFGTGTAWAGLRLNSFVHSNPTEPHPEQEFRVFLA